MKWLSFFSSKARDPELIDRYRDLRRVARNLNIKLIKELPKAALPECAKKLGIVKAGTMIFNNDDEIAVVYDYCLHHYRRGNKTVIDRWREQSIPPLEDDESTLLNAMSEARCSVFRIAEIRPRQGAALDDLAYGDRIELTDLCLADAAIPGTLVVGRVLKLPDLSMSSGTLIPLPDASYKQSVVPLIRKFLPNGDGDSERRLAPAPDASFTALLLRIALHAGGEDNVFYSDVEPVN
jgi:hypothetical protein